MNSICIVVNKYPNDHEPYMLVFVQQLAWTMADMGKKVTVICPMQVNLKPYYCCIPYHTKEKTDNGNYVDVFRPKTVGLGQSHYIFGSSPVHFTTYFLEKAVERVLKKESIKPDVLYGHFLAPAGIVAARLGRKMVIPAFVAAGETHDTIGQFGAENINKELKSICGVIAVSGAIKDWLVSLHAVDEEKIAVIPNAVNEKRFMKHDKAESRRKFGFPEDAVIAAFVGSFDERKGAQRVCRAGKDIPNLKMIFAGKGPLQPTGDNCIFAGSLSPDLIPYFNSASDYFVLPTLNEGCCNAIIEAMACGLPIVSSNGHFNDEILSDQNSIRVDPENVEEIKKAMETLTYDKELREKMSQCSLKLSRSFTLTRRTERIINFIDGSISEGNDKDCEDNTDKEQKI